MGSDNLFHKRKARGVQQRTRFRRERYPRLLIVCEDEKSGRDYLREVVCALGIQPQWVTIEHKDSAPVSVVGHALKLYDEAERLGESYDAVFCVFDRDNHESFDCALSKIKGAAERRRKPVPVQAIVSTPCIELWFLLHFSMCDRPFQSKPGKSVGDQAAAQLRQCPGCEGYAKNQCKALYVQVFKDKTSAAIRRAKKLREKMIATAIQGKDPQRTAAVWTDMDLLIRALYRAAGREDELPPEC